MSSRLIEFDDAKQEALVDIALAKIDKLPGGALRVRDFQRARFFQAFEFRREPGRPIERTGLIEGASDIGEFFRRGDDDPGEGARSRFGHAADEPDAKVPEHVACVALTPEGAEAFGGLRKFATDDRLEQLVLGVEIGVERALRDACGACDIIHARAVEAGAQKHLPRPLHDLAPFRAAVIARRRFPLQSLRFHTTCP